MSPGRQLHAVTGGTPCLLGISSVLWDAAGRGDSVWRATASGPQEPGCREDSCPPSAERSGPADDCGAHHGGWLSSDQASEQISGPGTLETRPLDPIPELLPCEHPHR